MCHLYLLCSWWGKRKSFQNCLTTIAIINAKNKMDGRVKFYLTEEKNSEGMTNLELNDEVLLGLNFYPVLIITQHKQSPPGFMHSD